MSDVNSFKGPEAFLEEGNYVVVSSPEFHPAIREGGKDPWLIVGRFAPNWTHSYGNGQRLGGYFQSHRVSSVGAWWSGGLSLKPCKQGPYHFTRYFPACSTLAAVHILTLQTPKNMPSLAGMLPH